MALIPNCPHPCALYFTRLCVCHTPRLFCRLYLCAIEILHHYGPEHVSKRSRVLCRDQRCWSQAGKGGGLPGNLSPAVRNPALCLPCPLSSAGQNTSHLQRSGSSFMRKGPLYSHVCLLVTSASRGEAGSPAGSEGHSLAFCCDWRGECRHSFHAP